ncbi:hypothetical protein T265_11952 [Opisthorchis viverrini]|uniref:Uncharacterized protein n=1 Tax=Opisthorchis viverrini TaxID=6198 RepID=A0A074Z7L2_OPIVI|nr:hypothetical protein T265_11952 [Opisthorchis viverrini]KER19190.1 hypothetical protein T265_11952 [Opisthorchis viverrini]
MEGSTVYSQNVSVILCFDGFLLLALCCLLGAAVALCSILLEDIWRRRGTIDPLRYIALSLDILSLPCTYCPEDPWFKPNPGIWTAPVWAWATPQYLSRRAPFWWRGSQTPKLATLILTERQRRCHQPRSETLFSYWLLLFLSVIPRIVGLIFSAANSVPTDLLETSFLPTSKRGLERIQLYALLVYMCSAFAHLLTQCFSPHNPSNSLLSDKSKRGLERIQLYALLVYMCSAFAHLLTQCFSPHNPSNSLLSDKCHWCRAAQTLYPGIEIALITIIDSISSLFNTDALLPYNHDLFESFIVKKRVKVYGGGTCLKLANAARALEIRAFASSVTLQPELIQHPRYVKRSSTSPWIVSGVFSDCMSTSMTSHFVGAKCLSKDGDDFGQFIQKHLRLLLLFKDENDVVRTFQIDKVFFTGYLNTRVLETFHL